MLPKLKIFLKRIINKILPKSVWTVYKKWRYFSILKRFDIKNQPDIIIAQALVRPGSFALDVGANYGLYSKYLSPIADRVFSIEPIEESFIMLRNNINRFEMGSVIPINKALSKTPGKITMQIPIDSAGTENFYRASIVGDDTPVQARIHEIEAISFDSDFLRIAEKISFIKLDVEGHEFECLKGAEQFLKRSSAAWLVECNDDPDELETVSNNVFEIFTSFGYSAYWFDGSILHRRNTGESSENYFFLQEKHLDNVRKYLVRRDEL